MGSGHWAGFTSNTSIFMLAKSCVFGKQSTSAIHCALAGLLVANVRRKFAEFLKDNSAITLAHLCPSTLVSFSTVYPS